MSSNIEKSAFTATKWLLSWLPTEAVGGILQVTHGDGELKNAGMGPANLVETTNVLKSVVFAP